MRSPAFVAFAALMVGAVCLGGSQPPQGPGDPPNQVKAIGARQAQLDVPVSAVTAQMLTKVSDPKLWGDIQKHAAAAAKAGRKVYLGLYRAEPKTAALVLTFDPKAAGVAQLLGSHFAKFDPKNTTYSVVDFAISTPRKAKGMLGNVWRQRAVNKPQLLAPAKKDPKPPADATTYEEGCCGILTTIHSLVFRMGKKINRADVTEQYDADGDGKSDGLAWKPSALKAVWDASGDSDGERGMYDSEIASAHGYNPGGAAAAKSTIDGLADIFDGKGDNVQSPGDCATLRKVADDINARLKKDEDLYLSIEGTNSDGDWGHAAPILSATYTAGPPCLLKIEVVRTSVQDPAGDFKDIPANPGSASYNLWSANGVTGCITNDFPGWSVTKLRYDAFGR